jgi:hypothetical protein
MFYSKRNSFSSPENIVQNSIEIMFLYHAASEQIVFECPGSVYDYGTLRTFTPLKGH